MSKNFSVGDVVVCVDDCPDPIYGRIPPLQRRALYTVAEAREAPKHGHCFPGLPLVTLERVAPHHPWLNGFGAWRFRLAFKPDPEVEREALKDPLTVQDKPKRRANAPKASEPHQ